jgi:hypothetical protein
MVGWDSGDSPIQVKGNGGEPQPLSTEDCTGATAALGIKRTTLNSKMRGLKISRSDLFAHRLVVSNRRNPAEPRTAIEIPHRVLARLPFPGGAGLLIPSRNQLMLNRNFRVADDS